MKKKYICHYLILYSIQLLSVKVCISLTWYDQLESQCIVIVLIKERESNVWRNFNLFIRTLHEIFNQGVKDWGSVQLFLISFYKIRYYFIGIYYSCIVYIFRIVIAVLLNRKFEHFSYLIATLLTSLVTDGPVF